MFYKDIYYNKTKGLIAPCFSHILLQLNTQSYNRLGLDYKIWIHFQIDGVFIIKIWICSKVFSLTINYSLTVALEQQLFFDSLLYWKLVSIE